MRNRFTLLLAITALGFGCSADYPASPTPTPTLATIQIHYSVPHEAITPNNSISLTLYAIDTEGIYEAVTNRAAWFSTDTAVVTAAGGLVRALRGGQADVVASYQGLTSTAHVFVRDANAPYPRLEISMPRVETGRTTRAVAFLVESGAVRRDVSDQATWTSSDARVFTVEAGGRVMAIGPGTAALTATFNGFASTSHSSVPPLQSLP